MEKIANARVIVCCPDRNFVTLRIETTSGVHGIGDIWEYLYKGAFWRRGPVPNFGIAARHPYDRAYLPVNRLEDGTMSSW